MHTPHGWTIPVLLVLHLVGSVRTIPEPATTTIDPRRRHGFFPNPHIDLAECGIRDGLPRSVCDTGRHLLPETVAKVENIINMVRNESFCPCEVEACRDDFWGGYKLGVAVVQNLALGGNQASGVNSEHMGKAVSDNIRVRYWKFGACGEDIILLLSIADGRIYMSVGESAQKTFVYQCELELGHRYMSMVRERDVGNYDKGLLLTLNHIKAILLDHRLCGSHVTVLRWWHMVIIGVAGLFSILVIVRALKLCRRTAVNNTTVT